MADEKKWIAGMDMNEGAFTRKAKRRGMSVAEFRSYVLSHKDDFDTSTVRQANLAKTFAKMARK